MRIWLVLIFNLSICIAYSQGITISGKITDIETGEKLIGVTCTDSVSNRFFISTNEGYYSFSTKNESITLTFSYVGYKPMVKTFKSSGIYDVEMKPGIYLNVIEVNPNQSITNSFSQLDSKTLLRLPNLLGESDVIKSLQYLPGVQGGSEGSSSIIVRGGSSDQNLVLWDDALIYNVNHLGGFFSVFNPQLVKNVKLYKSYIPANYGGRGSSVVNISTREGNKSNYKTLLDFGILNQNIVFEGPIKKDKSSFIISGRNSNLGVFSSIRNLLPNQSLNENRISFYDLTARINTRIGKDGQLIYSIFHGKDSYQNLERFDIRTNTDKLSWGNTVQSLKYTKYFNPKLFLNSTLSHTVYKSSLAFQEDIKDSKEASSSQSLRNEIKDWSVKVLAHHVALPSLELNTGVELIRHSFQPSYQNSLLGNDTYKNSGLTTIEGASFLSLQFKPYNKLAIEMGIRRSHLWANGKQFKNWEPRLNVGVNLSSKYGFGIFYTRMNQYMHSLSNTGTGFNVEVWVPANDKVPPLNVESLGLEHHGRINKQITWSQEVYVKNFINSIMYREGENLSIFQDQSWMDKINLYGQGKSWGIENALRFSYSKLDINAAYTWSKTDFRFNGVNKNQWFPFKYDRRHHLTMTGLFNLNKKWELNTAFILQSGQAFTAPVGLSLTKDQTPNFYYNAINNSRFPLYHRLDLGFTKSKLTKRNNEAHWSFGVFNLYNRKNPAYLDVELKTSQVGKTYEIVPKAILPIIPYVKYQLKF